MKLTLARQAALQFVGLYSLGDGDGDIEDAELHTYLYAWVGVDKFTVDETIFNGDGNSPLTKLLLLCLTFGKTTALRR